VTWSYTKYITTPGIEMATNIGQSKGMIVTNAQRALRPRHESF
jgi:hypothetical protein